MSRLHRTHKEISRDLNINDAKRFELENKLKELEQERNQLVEEQERKEYSLVELMRGITD